MQRKFIKTNRVHWFFCTEIEYISFQVKCQPLHCYAVFFSTVVSSHLCLSFIYYICSSNCMSCFSNKVKKTIIKYEIVFVMLNNLEDLQMFLLLTAVVSCLTLDLFLCKFYIVKKDVHKYIYSNLTVSFLLFSILDYNFILRRYRCKNSFAIWNPFRSWEGLQVLVISFIRARLRCEFLWSFSQ